MKPIIIVVGLLFNLFISRAIACDCVYNGPFVKVSKKTDLVSLLKVKKYLSFKNINGVEVPTSLEAEIITVYKGKDKRKTITVWGDNGNLCRPYLDTFKRGAFYVVALNSCKGARAQEMEKDEDYFVSSCGAYWLAADIAKQSVSGDIDGKSHLMPLKNVKQLVQ